jgi:hypothetical protein
MRRALIAVALAVLSAAPAAAEPHSLRYFGNGTGDIDRVKIRVDVPGASDEPPRPADVGRTNFTIEFWIRTTAGNTAGAVTCGPNIDWIYGNIVVDRDRYGQGRKFGLSLAGGSVVFGVTNGAGSSRTICGSTDLRDGEWHHVAVQRRRSDGRLWLWVDGRLEARRDGPGGDLSYPDDGVPGDQCGGPCTWSDPFLVIGAEKHDAGSAYPSYHGWLDELRLSTTLRYLGSFSPRARFRVDPDTAALYHFDEGQGTTIHDAANGADGVRRVGGDPRGPRWSAASPS